MTDVMRQKALVNVLLVEDDDGDAKAIIRAFKKASFENNVVRAIDGVTAWDHLHGLNGAHKIHSPKMILVDLNMPRMGGLELIRRLRGDLALKESIIFVLSTSNSSDDKLAAYQLNVAGYILKSSTAPNSSNLTAMLSRYWELVEFPK